MGAVQERRATNGTNHLYIIETVRQRFRHLSDGARGVVEHADGYQFAGVEGFPDRLRHGVGDALLADVNEWILAVRDTPKMGTLSGGEAVGHEQQRLDQNQSGEQALHDLRLGAFRSDPHLAETGCLASSEASAGAY